MRIPQIYAESDVPSHIPFTRQPPRDPQQVFEGLPADVSRPRAQAGPGVAMFEALERAGNALTNLGDRSLVALGEAERKRQEAIEHLEGVELFNTARRAIDEQVEQVEKKNDPFTHRKAVEDVFAGVMTETVRSAKSGTAKRYLLENFSRLHVELSTSARKFENERLIDRGRAAELEAVDRLEDQAVNAPTEADADRARLSMTDSYRALVAIGWMKDEEAAKDKQRRLGRIAVGRAMVLAKNDPDAVLDNPKVLAHLDAEEQRKVADYAQAVANRKAAARSREREERDREADIRSQGVAEELLTKIYKGEDVEDQLFQVRRDLGKRYDDLLRLNRERREARTSAATKSDPATVADLRLRIGRMRLGAERVPATLEEITRAYARKQLSESDYTSLSHDLVGAIEKQRGEAEKTQGKADQEAKERRNHRLQKGEELIERTLRRSTAWALSLDAERVLADALNEYWRTSEGHPDVDPLDHATKIADRWDEVLGRDAEDPNLTRKGMRYAPASVTADKAAWIESKKRVLADLYEKRITEYEANYFLHQLKRLQRRAIEDAMRPKAQGPLRKPQGAR